MFSNSHFVLNCAKESILLSLPTFLPEGNHRIIHNSVKLKDNIRIGFHSKNL